MSTADISERPAPPVVPVARFTAVSEFVDDPLAATPLVGGGESVPDVDALLSTAAIKAAFAARWTFLALCAAHAAALSVIGFAFGAPMAMGWAVSIATVLALAGASAARAGHANQSGGEQHVLVICACATVAVAAAAPWALRSTAWAQQPYAVAFFNTGLAAAVSSSLAPVKPLAYSYAALPLSSVLERLQAQGTAEVDLFAACVFAVAISVGIVNSSHRRWSAAARRSIAQDQRESALTAARDTATRADQEKSRFLAIASHDLRQPVHAIGLFAATLEKRLEGTDEAPLVRNLMRAIDGLDRSFNVMLDISRLDAGAIEPRVQRFPLRDLFRRLHMHFAGQAEQKDLGLRFSPGGKSVTSDPQLLERVLGNLVQNAVKYTEQGGIVVVARSTATHINVEVWDTGIGIRPADLPRVFEEFFQVGRGDRVRAQGLGMGLAIVKRLSRLMGHELTVSSRAGRGTMFRLAIAIGGLPGIQDATAPADTLPMPMLQPRTVLVIDDEESIREGLCLLLIEWGFEAIAAGSIVEAQHAVGRLETPPDVILTDLHLGDGPDGIAGIEAIRRACGFDVPAMLITGDTSHEEIRRATESGHHVLFKPVQPRKLYDAMRALGS